MKELFTAAKALTPKAVCVGYAYNYLMDLMVYYMHLIHNTIKHIYQMIIIVF